MLEAPREEVHLWMANLGAEHTPALEAACLDLLDGQERERQRRFHFARHRHQFLVSHALVRESLSRYAPVDPRDWRFAVGQFGRPEIANPGLSRLRFNLSHTEGLAACAVIADADIGADVEDSHRPGETVAIAGRFFAVAEVEALQVLPPERQRERFFEYWTLKEAYLKARGAGLSISLRRFAFEMRGELPPRIAIDPELADSPDRWQFLSLRPTGRHFGALAVGIGGEGRRAGGEGRMTLRSWWTTPGAGERS